MRMTVPNHVSPDSSAVAEATAAAAPRPTTPPPTTTNVPQESPQSPTRLEASAVKKELKKVYEKIIEVAEMEQKRLGEDVTPAALDYYKALKGRWRAIEKLPKFVEDLDLDLRSRNIQPVPNVTWGIENSGDKDATDPEKMNPIGRAARCYRRIEHSQPCEGIKYPRAAEKVVQAVKLHQMHNTILEADDLLFR